MKLPTTILLLVAVFFLQIGQASAAGKSDKSNKSNKSGNSIGTKELLARVEVLESAILNLQNPDVTGASFRTTYIGTSAVVIADGAGEFLRLATAYRTLNFNEDGTATWTLIDGTCTSGTLRSLPQESTFQMGAFCATPPVEMTYMQTGSNIDLFRSSGEYYSTMTVNHDGSVLMMSGTVGIGNVGEEIGGFQFLTIGLRISD